MNPDAHVFLNVILSLAALLGVAAGAIGIFVTRLEYRDVMRRVGHLEERFDGFTGGPQYGKK